MPQNLLGQIPCFVQPIPVPTQTMTEQQLPFFDPSDSSDWVSIDAEVYSWEKRGQIDEAKRIASLAVGAAREADPHDKNNKGRLAYCLEVRGNLFARQGDYGAAKEDYEEGIALVPDDENQDGALGRLFGDLAFVMECIGLEDESVEAYENALTHLRREKVPAVVDLIRLSNNLAFIYSSRNNFDDAETLYLKALKVAHEHLGNSDPDTTGIFNNIGALYQKAGHLDQASEMHTLALEGRKEDGSSDSDIGQSHGNLAIVCAEEGDEDESRKNFEDAIVAYKKAGSEFYDDFEAVCSNYMQLLRNVGDLEAEGRVEGVLAEGLE